MLLRDLFGDVAELFVLGFQVVIVDTCVAFAQSARVAAKKALQGVDGMPIGRQIVSPVGQFTGGVQFLLKTGVLPCQGVESKAGGGMNIALAGIGDGIADLFKLIPKSLFTRNRRKHLFLQ
ncbi:hypothetical protein DJ39_3370 [Yersinia ruckeri ATCC 29473]|nr:hypothetical protein DJ39_3370 [Yersinia ruckeri ATCC 29473]